MRLILLGPLQKERFYLNKIHVSKRCINVTFQNGARTALDSHESDQILILTQVRGVIGLINGNSIREFKIEDNDILLLENIGDTVCIPSNKLHFHGAIRKGEDFSHIAIRKLYEVDKSTRSVTKAENKWE
jgi:hypothetical protein